MGWTGLYTADAPQSYSEEKQHLVDEYTYSNKDVTSEVLAISKVGSVWYMAVKISGNLSKTRWDEIYAIEDDSFVYGNVVMTNRSNGEWQYKCIAETAGPVDAKAPQKILKLLSPIVKDSTTAKWAIKWRDNCVKSTASTKIIKSLKIGDRLKLKSPVMFGDIPVTEVTVSHYRTRRSVRRCYSHPSVGLLRLRTEHLDGVELIND